MAAPGTGNATPEKRAAREVLSLREPHIERLLLGLGIDPEHLAESRRFYKALTAALSRWDIARRRGGMFSTGRISKHNADVALKRQLAALEGGDA